MHRGGEKRMKLFVGWMGQIFTAMFVAGLFASGAFAQVYKCKQRDGRTEIRDFPCEQTYRPAGAATQSPTPPVQNPSTTRQVAPSQIFPVPGGQQDAELTRRYLVAREICLKLLSQFDSTAPLSRCGLNDTDCFNRASRESLAISRQLWAQPAWKQYQCDALLQAEFGDSNEDGRRFRVVGSDRQCKYFVAEQGGDYVLVDAWMCWKPRVGDVGYGDLGSYGFKDVKLGSSTCRLYVDNYLLSKSRVTEKWGEKCQ